MKKLITILGLLLIPISFTSAYTYKQDFNIPDTFVKGNMTYTILNNFNVSTYYQNTTLNHILFSESNLSSNGRNKLHSFLAWYEGKLYLYADYIHDGSRSYVYQGFPTKFCLASAGSGESVCVPSGWSCPVNTNIDVFYNAGKLTHGTYYGYGDFSSTYQPWTYCVSDNTYDYCFSVNASSQDCGNYLTGSLNVPGTSIEQLQSFDWSNSSFSPTQNTTYNEYSCPTIKQLLNTYGEEYNTNLCYSSNIIYSGGTIQTVTPKSIFELYPTLTELTQDIGNFNSYCNNASTTTACQTIFENKEEQYTLIAKIPNNVQPIKLYQYCNLSLNYEPTQTTCTTTGAIGNTGININDIITEIGKGDYTVITPGRPPESTGTGNGNGSVYDTILGNQEDDTERRNIVQNAKNIIQTMKELYAKFTGIFRGREGTQGIIPFYITGLILLIVLFKLFKK